jgi:hypothetical protein
VEEKPRTKPGDPPTDLLLTPIQSRIGSPYGEGRGRCVFILRYKRGIQLYRHILVGRYRSTSGYIEKSPGTDPTIIVQKSLDVCTQKVSFLHMVARTGKTTVTCCMFSQ